MIAICRNQAGSALRQTAFSNFDVVIAHGAGASRMCMLRTFAGRYAAEEGSVDVKIGGDLKTNDVWDD